MGRMRDLYSILGVSDRANSAEIKAAYRLLVKLVHPDLHLGDKEAKRRTQDINYAYGILSDPETRAAYDFKLKLHGLWARRRRRSATAAAGLAVFMLAITTLSITLRKHAESSPTEGDEIRLMSSRPAGGNQTIEVSLEGRANVRYAGRPAPEAAPSAGSMSVPPAETPEELRRAGTEIAAIPPSTFPSEPQAAQPPPEPVQQPDPQPGLANAEPSQPPARETASAGEISRPKTAQRDPHVNQPAHGRIQKKWAEGGRIIRSAGTRLQTARREPDREPRLVS